MQHGIFSEKREARLRVKKSLFSSKLGIGPVVAIALLLVVSVGAVVMFGNWYQTYQSSLFTQIEGHVGLNSVNPELLYGDKLYVKNSNSLPIEVTELKIANKICINSSFNLSPNDVSSIDLGTCLVGEKLGPKDVVLVTKQGVFSKTLLLKSQVFGNFTVSFKASGICDVGYTRVYGLEQVSNSHAEEGSSSNYTYSYCIKHKSYSLGTDCLAVNHVRLFYLDGASNAHGYETNLSPYESDWHPICISSDAGTLSSQISSTDPADGSVCIGSFDADGDETIGHHMGDCSSYTKRVWLKIN